MTSNRGSVYFVSDMHFGIPDSKSSLVREKLFVNWLDRIASNASDIYFMGDMFDFWFEWKHVVPKGYIRLLGKLAMLSDAGIQLHFFIGNHDMWMFSYLQKELNAHIYRKDQIVEIQGKTIYLSHGDGLGPGDHGYKFIKKLFRNPLAQWLYARLHPDFAVWLANFFSRKSRYSNKARNAADNLRERRLTDNQIIHARQILEKQHIDVFIFGHQHTPVHELINEKASVYNIGNWISDYTFLKMENGILSHCTFKAGNIELFSVQQ
jgi:UDP-2,3-diacylglucosamine hydrolase